MGLGGVEVIVRLTWIGWVLCSFSSSFWSAGNTILSTITRVNNLDAKFQPRHLRYINVMIMWLR